LWWDLKIIVVGFFRAFGFRAFGFRGLRPLELRL